jgi:hypothetical protein
VLSGDNERLWQVVRQSDGAVLGRYASKANALAAALRFGADGCNYVMLEDTQLKAIPSVLVPLRRH